MKIVNTNTIVANNTNNNINSFNVLMNAGEAIAELRKLREDARYSWASSLLTELDLCLKVKMKPRTRAEMVARWTELATADLRSAGIWR